MTDRALPQGFAAAAANWRAMRQDLAWLVRIGQEDVYRRRAIAIFGHLLAQGHDATSQVADQLQEVHQRGVISGQEFQEVLAADLLWAGQVRDTGREVVLVLEASWTVQVTDVERATERAAVLRRAGLTALPVVAGQEWPSDVQAMARRAGVVIVQDGMVDRASWEANLAGL